MLICSIGAVNATDLGDNSTVEVSSDVDDSISVDEVPITDDVEQSQDVASTNAATWDELKTACQSSGDKVITLTGQSYNADSQIVFGNSATIVGSSDSYITVNNGNLIPFLNSNSELSITFLNVNFKDSNCDMLIQLCGDSKLENCTFDNITVGSNHKSVLYNTYGSMDVSGCNFTDCTSSFGVITNYNPSSTTNVLMNVENCNFENNAATYAPGAINNCGILYVSNSNFTGNSARYWAGAIHTHCNAYTRISNSEFKSNTAGWNGGALYSYSKLEVYNSTFTDNNCTTNNGGGAIGAFNYISTYNITVENCVFKDNHNLCNEYSNESTTSLGRGGAISVLNGGYLDVHDSTFVHNGAAIGQSICAYNTNYDNSTGGIPYLQIYNNEFINHTVNTNDTVFISEGNYTFRNNTFTNSPQTIGTDDNIIESNNVNLLKSLKIRSIVFNQPISDSNSSTVIQNQWAMTGYDNHNSANVPYIGVTTNPNIWKKDVGGAVSGLVIDDEGNFYLIAGSNVSAFDSTGLLKWSKNLGSVTMPGLALDNRGNIIIPVKDNRLVILNKTTGADLGGNIFQASSAYAPILDDDGNIYVVGQYEYDNGYVPIVKYSNTTYYNPDGGYDYAYKSLFNTAVSTIPVLDNNGVLWAVSGTNLVGVDIKTGNQVASYADCYSAIRPIVGENGIVYFVKSDRKAVYAVSVDGYLWNRTLPTYKVFRQEYIEQATVLGVDNENNALYVGTSKSIHKIDMTTGNLTTFIKGLDSVNSIFVDGNGTLYATKIMQGSLRAYYSNGTQAWSKSIGGSLKLLAIDKTGNIYTSYNNYLCVLHAEGVDPNMTIDAKNILANENTDIVVKFLDGVSGNVVFTINNDIYTVAIENGTAKLNIGNLSVGSYNVTASFAANIKYTASENKTSFVVSKVPTTLLISADAIDVGEDAVINITLPDGISNELVNVTIDGKVYTVLINNGKGSLTLSNLIANSYPIIANYSGDYKYTEGGNTTTLTVSKLPSTVNVSASNIKFGEDAVINITVPNVALGVATVVVNGKSYNVAIVDEKGVLTISNLAANDYDVKAVYLGDNKYLSSENTTKFTVSKVGSFVNVAVSDIKVGDEAVINIAVPDDATGNVTVNINGKSYNVTTKYGMASIKVAGLANGTYDVKAVYLGDNKYLSSENTTKFTVSKVSDYNMTVDIADIIKGENATITVTTPKDGTGSVVVTINGTDYKGTVVNGTAKVIIPGLDEGTYKVVTFYTGDNKYDSMVVNGTITVNKNTKTTLTMDNLVKYFNGPQKLMAKLVDGFGNPIANATVYFTINGKVYARITDENGTASIAIRLLPGEYKASALFNGTGDYDVTSVNASVLVKNTILGNDTTLYFRNGTQYVAKFLDSNGKALANTDVKFNINGVFYTRVTDENGIARLNIRLDPASYIITAYNPVTGEQKANNITVLPRIIAKDLSMKYLDGSTFNATLVDGQGKAIAGVNITFNVNGVFYHRTTDANGVARLNIRLMPGDYIITSMYDECWASNKITISA